MRCESRLFWGVGKRGGREKMEVEEEEEKNEEEEEEEKEQEEEEKRHLLVGKLPWGDRGDVDWRREGECWRLACRNL